MVTFQIAIATLRDFENSIRIRFLGHDDGRTLAYNNEEEEEEGRNEMKFL